MARITKADRNPVAALQSSRGQSRGKPLHGVLEFGEGPRFGRLVWTVHIVDEQRYFRRHRARRLADAVVGHVEGLLT